MGKSGKTDRIEQFNTWFSQDIESYKEFAKNRVAAVRYSQEYLTELAWNIKDYLTEQEKNDTPFTVTGLYVSLDMQKKDYYRAKNGEFDWRLYQFADFHGITLDELDELEEIEDEYLGRMRIWVDEDGQVFIMETYSTIIEKALLVIQDQVERLCYSSNNPKGAIFILKSRFGWSDKNDGHMTVIENGIPQIATYEQAKAAMERLEGDYEKEPEEPDKT